MIVYTDVKKLNGNLKCHYIQRLASDECEENSIYILSEIDNISKVNTEKTPLIIYAKYGLEEYPIIKNTYLVEDISEIDVEFVNKIYNRFYGISNIVLETERLIIREEVLDDIPKLYEIYKDEEITRYTEGLYENYQEEVEFTKAYIENMYGFYGYGIWMVEEKEGGRLVGRCGLSNREIDGQMELELGYIIGKQYQGKGYAYEASLAILEFAKKEIEKEEIFICTETQNIPSIKLANKLGFKECGKSVSEGREYIILIRNL